MKINNNKVNLISNKASFINRAVSALLIICMIITMSPVKLYADNQSYVAENSDFFANSALQKITAYYKDRQNKNISAPMEGVARFAVGYPATISALYQNEYNYTHGVEIKMYHTLFNSFEMMYGENAQDYAQKSWFLCTGINTQTWLSQIILDIIAVGGDPANFNGRNYVYSLMKYQSKGTAGLFSNKGKYTGSADGLATIALDAYWGDNQWPMTDGNQGLGRAASVKAMLDNYKYTYTGAEGSKMDLSSFRKGSEWGLGTIGKQATQEAIFYNIFWASQGLSRYATVNASTSSAITASAISKEISSVVSVEKVQDKLEVIANVLNNKKVAGQSFEIIRKGQCELQAAYIISLLSAGIKVEENEWNELIKFQLDDGSFKRKADNLITNGESTAMAAIAMDYGRRVAAGEDRTTCSAFNRLKNNKDTADVQQDIKNVLADQKAISEKISTAADFNELLSMVKSACDDESYKSKVSFFSKIPDGIIAYNDINLPKDGDPDIFASLVVVIEHGMTMDVIETGGYLLKSDDTTFPLEKNSSLLRTYYMNKKNDTGMDCAFEPVALLSFLEKDELSDIKNSITFYDVKTNDRYSTAESYYSLAANDYYPEAFAIIDEIALGNDPKKYQRAEPGTGEVVEADLIKELLTKQKEDGSFGNSSLLDLSATLALEAYLNGDDWGNEKANTAYGRKGAIEALLSFMTDCDGVENGRSYGKKPNGNNLTIWNEQQSYMVFLLSRWLNDETVVTVGDKTDALKSFVKGEIDGLIKTLDAVYDGQFTNGKCGFRHVEAYTKYISALIASGNKQKIEDEKIWDTLRNSRLLDGRYPYYLTDVSNIASLGIKRDVSVYDSSCVAMAMGDYLNNKAILATIFFDINALSDDEAVNNDLSSIVIPDTTIENINLINKGFYGSTISWTSSNLEIINPETGIIKRPDIGQRNAAVKLTATIKRNTVTKSCEFYVIVLAKGSQAQEIVNADYTNLNLPIYITESLTLPVKGSYGSDISWISSNEAIISNDGNVIFSDAETNVKLTATLTYNEFSRTKEFELTVSKKIDNDNVVEKAINQFRESYNTNRNLTGSYWDIFAAKSVLGDDFDKYNFNVYDVKSHRKASAWQATDYSAIILQILSQGDNPYNYQGVNYVEQLLNWLDDGWGGYGNPIWALMALDAAAADYEGHSYKARDILGFYLAQLKDLQYGPDLAGWGLIPLSNHIDDDAEFRDSKILPDLEAFKLTLKSSQEKSGKNKGLFNTGGVEGGILTLSNGCVVSGFSALNAIGLDGYDLADDYWKVDDTGVLEAIYNIDVNGKEKVSTQEIIEFGDVYYGDSVWKRVGIKKDQFIDLINSAKKIVENDKSLYTANSFNNLIKAYDYAAEIKNNSEKMTNSYYGPAYFELRDKINQLKPVGTVAVTIIGDKNIILDNADICKTGNLLDVLEEVVNQNKISLSIIDNKIIEIGGVVTGKNGDWYCYEKTAEGIKRVTEPLNTYMVNEGAEITFKHCSDVSKYDNDTTLQQHIINDAKDALQIEGNIDNNIVTGDLILTNTGLFGSTISWLPSKLLVIDENGRVNRDAREDIKVNLLAKIYYDGVETEKSFEVVVKGLDSGSTGSTTKYAYIRVVGPVGSGIVYCEKKAIAIEPGETAFSILEKTNLPLNVDMNTKYGVYVRGISGLNEFDKGPDSGWLYRVNGVFPGHSAALERIYENDYVEWLYTRDLGKDVGGYVDGITLSGTTNSTAASSIHGNECVAYPNITTINGEITAIVNKDSFKKVIDDAKSGDFSNIIVDVLLTEKTNKITMKIDVASLSEAYSNSISITMRTALGTITFPKNAMADIADKSGSTISIAIELLEDGGYAVTIKIDKTIIEGIDGGIILSLPSDNSNNSTVLAVVNEDGTYKIIKKSFVFNDSAKAMIDGSAKIKLISNEKEFDDVTNDDWFAQAIAFVTSHELFGGTSDNEFNPEAEMTRAMLVTVLHRLEDTPDGGNISFDDVEVGKYYSNAVAWASNSVIVTGDGNGFNPDGYITREQLATILYRYAEKLGMNMSSTSDNFDNIEDKDNISDWATQPMKWAIGHELISGKENGMIDPKANATRAEVATILVRFMKQIFK